MSKVFNQDLRSFKTVFSLYVRYGTTTCNQDLSAFDQVVVQPGYNIIPFESNNAQLVKFIFRTGNTVQVLHYLFNTQSGRDKRQFIRNYEKRRKERHDHNSESKQMNYERLLILCIILLYILLLLIK